MSQHQQLNIIHITTRTHMPRHTHTHIQKQKIQKADPQEELIICQNVQNLHVFGLPSADSNSNFGPAGINSDLLPGRGVHKHDLCVQASSAQMNPSSHTCTGIKRNKSPGKRGVLKSSKFAVLKSVYNKTLLSVMISVIDVTFPSCEYLVSGFVPLGD